MSEILEAATSHFRSKMSGVLDSIEVPEWKVKGKPAKLFFKPSLNFHQQERILALSDKDKKGEAIIEALIQRALDEDGNRMFRSTDRTELMRHVDPDVVSRVVGAMSGEDIDSEKIEKN